MSNSKNDLHIIWSFFNFRILFLSGIVWKSWLDWKSSFSLTFLITLNTCFPGIHVLEIMLQNHGLLKILKSTKTNKQDHDYNINLQILNYKEILNTYRLLYKTILFFFFKRRKRDRTVYLMMEGDFWLILQLTEEIELLIVTIRILLK